MNIELARWAEADNEPVRALAGHASIAPQFEQILGPGRLEHWLADPFCNAALRWIARADGELAGFAYAFLFHDARPPWTMLRIAVAAPFRRQGIGTRLFQAQLAALAERMPGCREISASAWEPCLEATGFFVRHEFRTVRHFWMMERPVDGLQAPEWPREIEVRAFDGSEQALTDWNDVYNSSFARHYHYVPGTVETCRTLAASPRFADGALLLAYEGARCVGFCRDDIHTASGEVSTLGVAPEWQGRGLGRALLRWGAQWLVEHGALPITLIVDGENESALRLYRSEGFQVSRTRHHWSRALANT